MKNPIQYDAGDMAAIRLSESDAYLLRELGAKLGMNVTGLFRLAIRALAEQHSISLQKQAAPRKRTA